MEGNSKIVTVELDTPVSDKESARLAGLLERRIAGSGKIRLLLFLKGYPARDAAEALFEDIEFINPHARKIERMAVVGDRAWQDTWTAIFGLFAHVETTYFDASEGKEAARWLEE
jgi:hypothetical protein